MSKVSAYIIAFNEAEKIADAVDSVAWADEVLVLDSHSTDDTASIAAEHGAEDEGEDEDVERGLSQRPALEEVGDEGERNEQRTDDELGGDDARVVLRLGEDGLAEGVEDEPTEEDAEPPGSPPGKGRERHAPTAAGAEGRPGACGLATAVAGCAEGLRSAKRRLGKLRVGGSCRDAGQASVEGRGRQVGERLPTGGTEAVARLTGCATNAAVRRRIRALTTRRRPGGGGRLRPPRLLSEEGDGGRRPPGGVAAKKRQGQKNRH